MKPETARDYLTEIVVKEKKAFATQKQALNALVFFFKDVCGMETVDPESKIRRRHHLHGGVYNRAIKKVVIA
jgi:hypothetical protein